jgi:hypothetical protein
MTQKLLVRGTSLANPLSRFAYQRLALGKIGAFFRGKSEFTNSELNATNSTFAITYRSLDLWCIQV